MISNGLLEKKHSLAALLLALYFIVCFGIPGTLEKIGIYVSYIFEVLFVLVVWLMFKQQISFKIKLSRRLGLDAFMTLLFGFVVYRLASASRPIRHCLDT